VNNKNADVVIGQNNFTNEWPGPASDARFYNPSDVAFDPSGNGRLFVADSWYNRVVVFDGPFTTGMAGTAFLGQPDSSSTSSDTGANRMYRPAGVSWDDTHGLWVADQWNHRVLRFSPPFATDMSADLVLGQLDFVSNGMNHSSGLSQPSDPGPVSGDQSLYRPQALVCTGNHVIVVDRNNYRVMIWDPVPVASDAEASWVLGSLNFSSKFGGVSRMRMSYPLGVESDGASIYVADGSNNRILIWDSFPVVNGQDADRMIGQPDFNSSLANRGGVSARSLYTGTSNDQWEWTESPVLLDIAGEKHLWFPDQRNNRVLRYDVTP
jgi:DNA-binding beta-propeller fold protein YncE